MNFCSNCGSEQVDEKIPEGDRFKRLICNDCEKVHYQNPRMIVGCLPYYGDGILLLKRGIEPRYGYWNLPAGFLESRERVEDGALRETWEEARADVELIRLHCIYNLPHADQVYMHFLASMNSKTFEAAEETLEAKLFHPDEIPWKDIAFSSTTYALERYLAEPERKTPHIGSKEYQAD